VWVVQNQDKVQELNEALTLALIFSRERRRGGVSGVGVRTWEGMEERLQHLLELFCEVIVWETNHENQDRLCNICAGEKIWKSE